MPLTDTSVRTAKPAEKPFKLSDEKGLFLLVHPSGSKLWRQKYRFGGKEKLLAHGAYPEITLKEARERRDEARRLASTGYCVLRPIQSQVITNFLAHLLGTDRFRKYVEEKLVPGNYPSIPDSRVREFRIPVPSAEEQERIVAILEKFDVLVNDLSSGLPAEIKALRQQYEHYRDKLLSFAELEATA